MDPALLALVRELVTDIARGRFDEVAGDGRGGRLGADDLRRAIREYGRTILPLPDHARIEVLQSDLDPNEQFLDVRLWTSEEGESDLTLQLLARRESGTYRVHIEDLHVL